MSPEPSGMGVDSSGGPVIDPTANVLSLVEAAVKRLDDLREQDSKHIREIMDLRTNYEEKLSTAESGRIDAIRAVDVGAVQRAAEVQATAAQALATQATALAETLRTQVATTATAGQTSLAAALEPIQKDVQDLRRVQYEQQGQRASQVDTRSDSRANLAIFIAAFSTIAAVVLGVIAATQ